MPGLETGKGEEWEMGGCGHERAAPGTLVMYLDCDLGTQAYTGNKVPDLHTTHKSKGSWGSVAREQVGSGAQAEVP